jgi:hypothetical protein
LEQLIVVLQNKELKVYKNIKRFCVSPARFFLNLVGVPINKLHLQGQKRPCRINELFLLQLTTNTLKLNINRTQVYKQYSLNLNDLMCLSWLKKIRHYLIVITYFTNYIFQFYR